MTNKPPKTKKGYILVDFPNRTDKEIIRIAASTKGLSMAEYARRILSQQAQSDIKQHAKELDHE